MLCAISLAMVGVGVWTDRPLQDVALASALGLPAAALKRAFGRSGTLRNLGLVVEAAVGEVEAAERSLRESLDRVAEEQERYGEARRERRVVERLREHRRENWTEDLKRDEQQEQDGLARHHAQGRSGS